MRKIGHLVILKAVAIFCLIMAALLPFARAQVVEDGTEEHPFLIESLQELMDFHDCMNTNDYFYHDGQSFVTTDCGSGCIQITPGGKLPGNIPAYFKLTTDIEVNTGLVAAFDGDEEAIDPSSWTNWTPIITFCGVFDGDYHTISGIFCRNTGAKTGFFTELSNAVVKNLGIVNSYIKGIGNTGGIAGNTVDHAIIDHCFYWGTVEVENGTQRNVGGIVGYNSDGSTIRNCYATGNLHSNVQRTGGIAGYNQGSGTKVQNCYSSMRCVCEAGMFGGVVGESAGGGTMTNNCFYDVQMTYNELRNDPKKLTAEMASTSFTAIGTEFDLRNGMYPALKSFDYDNNPWVRLSVTPLFLRSTTINDKEDIDHIITDFTVGQPEGGSWGTDSWNTAATFNVPNTVHLNRHGPVDLTVTIDGDKTRLWYVVPYLYPYLGMEQNPYTICNIGDFTKFRNGINSGQRFRYKKMWITPSELDTVHWLQTEDINLSGMDGASYIPCGNTSIPFRGYYNGGHHILDSLTITGNNDYVGLFGAARRAHIKNVNFHDPNITGKSQISVLCGRSYHTLTVDSCSIDGGTLTASGGYCGGLVGYADSVVTMSDCSARNFAVSGKGGCSDATTAPAGGTGGICGYVNGRASNNISSFIRCSVQNCAVRGESCTGGILGAHRNNGVINGSYISKCNFSDCTNERTLVTGCLHVGGIAGRIHSGSITDCSAADTIIVGTEGVGGIIGRIDYSGSVSNSICTMQSVTQTTSNSGNVGGICGASNGWVSGSNNSQFTDCYNYSDVFGYCEVGGILGDGSGGTQTVTNCHNYGRVERNRGEGPNVGGIVGAGTGSSSVRNCTNNGNVVGAGDAVGGLMGAGGYATNSQNYGTVLGKNKVGGLIGAGGYATNSINYGASVTGTGDNVGGLIGVNGSTTSNCINYSHSVVGNNNVGGLVGSLSSYTVDHCLNASDSVVGAGNNVGGLVGSANAWNATSPANINYCINISKVRGAQYVGGGVGTGGRITYTINTNDVYCANYGAGIANGTSRADYCANYGNVIPTRWNTFTLDEANILMFGIADSATYSYTTGRLIGIENAMVTYGVGNHVYFDTDFIGDQFYSIRGIGLPTTEMISGGAEISGLGGNFLYESGRYPRLAWTDSYAWARNLAIAASYPVLFATEEENSSTVANNVQFYGCDNNVKWRMESSTAYGLYGQIFAEDPYTLPCSGSYVSASVRSSYAPGATVVSAIYNDTIIKTVQLRQNVPVTCGTLTIDNLEELQAFRDSINTCESFIWKGCPVPRFATGVTFRLTADIDMPNEHWTPIGNNYSVFRGVFLGDGHTINGLTGTTGHRCGLFCHLNGRVQDLNFTNVSFPASTNPDPYYRAAVCSYLRDGSVLNCTASGTLAGNSYKSGGIVGWSDGFDTIRNCTNTMILNSSKEEIGGIVGRVSGRLIITNCHNTANLNATYVGGIIGRVGNHHNSHVTTGVVIMDSCTNTGNMSGKHLGGIIGEGHHAGSTVAHCTNTGLISGSGNVGGIMGRGFNYTISYCVNEKNITSSGDGHGGGISGGAGPSTSYSYTGFNEKTRGNKLYHCVNRGNVNCKGSAAGIIVNDCSNVIVDSCENYGDVVSTTNNTVGGIMSGTGNGANSARISYCTNYGTLVSGVNSTSNSVGGISTTPGTVNHCDNYADVIGAQNVSGILASYGTANYCNNYGSLVKGPATADRYATGIILGSSPTTDNGTANYCYNAAKIECYNASGIVKSGTANHCANSGDIVSNAYNTTWIAGICMDGYANYCYNVGQINAKTGNPGTDRFVGGIVGRGKATYCYNAAIVYGFNSKYVGGIVGYAQNGQSRYCYNSNTTRSSGGANYGSIAGAVNGSNQPLDCYYDKQMSPMGGVKNADNSGNRVIGLLTTEMLSDGMRGLLGDDAVWTFTTNFYPQLTDYRGTSPSLSSVMPVILNVDPTMETAMYARSSFYMKGCDIGEWHLQQGAAITLDTASRIHQCESSVTGFGIIKLASSVGGTIYRRDRILIGISEDAPYIIKNLTEMKNFRDVINKNGFYNMADSTYHLTLSSDDSTHLSDFAEIQDGGMDLYFKLIVDLDFSSIANWTPVGDYYGNNNVNSRQFFGTFFGDNHTITNLTLGAGQYRGLFGSCNLALVKDLKVINSKITSTDNTPKGFVSAHNVGGPIVNCSSENNVIQNARDNNGFVCGFHEYGGRIHNCHSLSDTIQANGTNSYIGGICGYEREASIDSCYSRYLCILGTHKQVGGICGHLNKAKIHGCRVSDSYFHTGENVGGIFGYAEASSVTDSCSAIRVTIECTAQRAGGIMGYQTSSQTLYCTTTDCEISSTSSYVGGICGQQWSSTVSYCSTTGGIVTSTVGHVGGIVGVNENSTIIHCTNENPVMGTNNLGGIAGYNATARVEDCKNYAVVKGTANNVGGIVGVTTRYSNYGVGNIVSCVNYADVRSDANSVGGIIGNSYYTNVTGNRNFGNVNGNSYVGGTVGYNNTSSGISGCLNKGQVNAVNQYAGGIAGTSASTINASYNYGNVTAKNDAQYTSVYAGGVVSNLTDNASITRCFNTGVVTGNGDYVGGLAGRVSGGSHRYSFNASLVTGKNKVGGLVGSMNNYNTSSFASIQHCYNTGVVLGSAEVGGLIGETSSSGESKFNYSAGWVQGVSLMGAICGYTPQNLTGKLKDNFYDYQLCYFGPMADQAHSGSIAKLTTEMLGTGLQYKLGDAYWTYTEGMYPRIKENRMDTTNAGLASTLPVLLPVHVGLDTLRADDLPIDIYPNSLAGCDSVTWFRMQGEYITLPDNCSFEGERAEQVRLSNILDGDSLRVVQFNIGISNQKDLYITDRIQLKNFRDLINSGNTFYYDHVFKEFHASPTSHYVIVPPYGQYKNFILLNDIDLSLESEDWEPIGNYEGSIEYGSVNISNTTTIVECGNPINFYDDGGPNNNYSNSKEYRHTFTSADDSPLSVFFYSSGGEGGTNYDWMIIYDGPNTSSPQLLAKNTLSGNNLAARHFVSTGSSITVHFRSDGSNVGSGWTAVVSCGSSIPPYFKGVFDGNGHTISGVTIAHGDKDNQGLFGVLQGTVKNLKLENTMITANGDNHGSLVGYNMGMIRNCGSTMGVVQGNYYVGGLVGRNTLDWVEDCYNGNDVTGVRYVGGIAGECYGDGNITRCFNYGVITGTLPGATDQNTCVGGIVGVCRSPAVISHSYNTGIIHGERYVGGIAGYYNNNDNKLTSCYNAGMVDTISNQYVGSILGYDAADGINTAYDWQMSPYFKSEGRNASLGADWSNTRYTTLELTGTALQSKLGTEYWTYSAGMYPRLKSMDTLDASYVSTKIVDLPYRMKVNEIIYPFTVETGDGVEWSHYGDGNALNTDLISLGSVKLNFCGDDTLQVTKNGDRRLVPFKVTALAAEVLMDTACYGSYVWAATGRVFRWTGPGVDHFTEKTLIPAYEGCDSIVSIDLLVPPALTIDITFQNHRCYDDHEAYAQVIARGGFGAGATDRYLYYWTDEHGDTIANTYRIDHTTLASGRLEPGTYHVSVRDMQHPSCEMSGDATITEPTELVATVTGSDHRCYNQSDGYIALEVAGGKHPYTISWETGSQNLTAAGIDTIQGLDDGNYHVVITDHNNCVVDTNIALIGNDLEHAITAMGVNKMYDGVAVNLGQYIVQIDGGTPDTLASGASKTLADGAILTVTVTNTANQKDYITGVQNEIDTWTLTKNGVDVSCQYNIMLHNSPVEISKRDVVLTSATDSKLHDGTPLENHAVTISGSGFVAGEDTLSTNVTGQQLNAGTSANTFDATTPYTLTAATNPANYDIQLVEGTLTVYADGTLVLVANSATKMYDGTVLEEPTFTPVGIHANDTVIATVVGSQLNVGTSLNVVDTTVIFIVKDKTTNLSTRGDYDTIVLQAGNLTVTPRNVTLTTTSGTKEYDGDPLTRPEVTVSGDGIVSGELAYSATMSITNVGDSINRIDTVRGANFHVENYNLTLNQGHLIVTQRPLTITGETRTVIYNRTEQSIVNYYAPNLLATDTIVGLTYRAAGTEVNEDPGYAGVFTPGDAASVVIQKKVGGEIVTGNYNIADLVPGRLYITGNNLPVVIRSNSQSFLYDHQLHKYPSYTVLYDEESMIPSHDTIFTLTTGDVLVIHPMGAGRGITNVTESGVNDFNYDLSPSYQNVTVEKGNITVEPRHVTIRSRNYTMTYDGTYIPPVEEMDASYLMVSGDGFVSGEGVNYNFLPEVRRKDVGSNPYRLTFTYKTNTLPSNYVIDTVFGTLTVNPATLHITAVDTFKIYGRENPEPFRYVFSGFVNGEDTAHGAPFIGAARPMLTTTATSSSPTGHYPINVDITGVSFQNYTLVPHNGDLAIRYCPIQLTALDADTIEYDGLEHTWREGNTTADGLHYELTGGELLPGEAIRSVNVSGVRTVAGTSLIQLSSLSIWSYEMSGTDTVWLENVSDRYDPEFIPGKLPIKAKDLVIKPFGYEHDFTGLSYSYDSTAAPHYAILSGLQPMDTLISISLSGSRTLVGETPIVIDSLSISIVNKDSVTNYNDIPSRFYRTEGYHLVLDTATLRINHRSERWPIVLQGRVDTIQFDGQGHSIEGFVNMDTVINGHTYRVEGITSRVENAYEVGTHPASIIGTWRVYDEMDRDMTEEFEVTALPGHLTITKRDIELVAYGLRTEYDGRVHSPADLLWPRCRITGGPDALGVAVIHKIGFLEPCEALLPGDSVTVHILVDSVEIWNSSNQDITSNYNISVVDSSIVIYHRTHPIELTVRAAHDTVEYNSEIQRVEGFDTLRFMYNDYFFTVSGLVADTFGLDVGYYKNTIYGLDTVWDEFGNNVSTEFLVHRRDDTLRITQRPITITADDSIRMYNGFPLTDNGWHDNAPVPAVNDTVVYVAVNGSQTYVGDSPNVPSAAVIKRTATDVDVTANYDITYVNGTLTITPDTLVITITSADHEWVFDGELHKDETYTVTYNGISMIADASGKKFGLPTGDTVRITPTAAGVTYISDNDSDNNTFTYTIDHQNQYVADSIKATYGTLSIAKKDLLITVNDTKQYDQTVLTTQYDNATAVTTDELVTGDALTAGAVKSNSANVGVYTSTASTSVIDVAFATTKGIGNYNVTYNFTQTITRGTGMEVFCPTATDTVKMYDGTALSPVATGSVPNGTTVTIEYKTATSDWSTTVPSITHVDDGPLAVEVRGVNENYDTVYCNYKLRITPRPIELTAASQEFVFDGDAHTYHVAHTTGTYHFVGADTMDFQFDPASEITFVTDTIDNVITGATPTGSTQANDYTFTYLPGKLTMVFGPAVPLTLTARDTAWVFDGNTHHFHSYTLSLNHGTEVTVPASANGVYNFPHDIVLTVTFDPTSEITDYSTAGVANKISSYTIMYGTADVSSVYDVEIVDGRLRIIPDTITVTAMDSVFFYDGTVKTQPRYTVTGLVGGAAVSASTSGSIQYVSQSPVTNVITAELIAGIPQNYYLKKVNGTLTMQYTEPEPTVAITAKSGSWTYDGTAHVKDSCEVVFNSITYQVGPDGNVNLAHGDVLHVEVTGSITNQGSVPNVVDTFYITNNGVDVSGAYSVSRLPGTLTVTQLGGVVVNITGHNAVATYDGNEHRVTGYDVTSISEPLFTVNDISYIGSVADTVAARTNAGTTEMTLANTMFESNNSNFENVTFVVVPGNVSIDEKALTITAADSIFVYDGTEKQQPRYTIEGLVGTDAITIVGTTGRITYVDESPVVNRVDTGSVCNFSSGLRSNYDITLVDGSLTMDFGPKTPITVTASSYTWTYDGTNHTLPTYKVSVNGGVADSVTTSDHTYAFANGDTLTVTMSSFSTIRNVSQSTVVNQIANVTLTNHGHNVADNYIVTRADGELNVVACPVVITAADSVFVYDGNSKTQPRYTVTGLVGTDNLTAMTSGSIQFPSQSPQPNTISGHNFMSGSSDNYSVSYVAGELTMAYQSPKPEITITAKSGTWTYDGTLHVKDSCEVVFDGTTYPVGPDGNLNLFYGDVLHVNINGSIDTVGSIANVVATDWTILHGSENVADAYTVNTPVNGTLTITKRETVITANSATKEYDGAPLTDNGWNNTAPTNIASTDVVESVTVTGTQTEVGTSNNVPSNAVIKRGSEDVTSNYEITYVNGTLEVTANTKAIAVTSADGSWMYDGSTHTKPEFTVTYDGTAIAAIAGTDGLRYKLPTNDTITLSNLFAGITNFSENAANNNTFDVFLQNSGNYGAAVSTNYGTLEITQRSVTLTSGSESRLYNGLPLTKPEVLASGDGFVTGEVSNIRAIGTITNIGSVTNTITFDTIPAYQASNYNITKHEGTLEITGSMAPIVIASADGSWVYDDADHTKAEYTVTYDGSNMSALAGSDGKWFVFPTGDTLKITPDASAIVHYMADNATNNNTFTYMLDNDVAYFGTRDTIVGTIAITKRPISITANSLTVMYDGDSHDYTETVSPYYTVTAHVDEDSLVVGHTMNVPLTGSRTDAGAEPIVIGAVQIFDASSNDVTGNYEIEKNNGLLTINPRTGVEVTIQEHGAEVVFDNTPHTVSGFSVSINDPLYHVSDFNFIGDSIVTEVGVEDELKVYPMELEETDFANNNSNFTGVRFIISDSALYIYPKMKASSVAVAVSCNELNGGVHNDGNATITVTGGRLKSGDTYDFALSGATPVNHTSPYVINGLTKGHYIVEITDSIGTTVTTEFDVDEPAELTATVTVPTDLCPNQGNYNVNVVTNTGGTPDYHYEWGGNATDADNTVTTVLQTATNDCGVSYVANVTVTDSKSCTVTATNSFTVVDNEFPTFTVPANTTICRVNGEIVAPIATTGDVTDESDNCSTGIEAVWTDLDTLPLDNSGNRVIRRQWTLTDECGNSVVKVQAITVRPSVLTPGNIDFTCPDTTVTLKYGVCDTLIELHRVLVNNMTGMTLVLDSTGMTYNHRYNVDNSPYTVTWRVSDECGDYLEFTQTVTVQYPPCGPSVLVADGDGILYPTVQAGCNCWTARNARSTLYTDGTPITPAPMQYPGTEQHPEDTIYGKLYTFSNATRITPTRATRAVPQQVQGICPDGWHIPDDDDFIDLMSHYEASQLMSTEHWLEPGTDDIGFTLEPAGMFNPELLRYEYLHVKAFLWSYTPGSTVLHACEFGSACGTIEIVPATASTGYSVRCVHDAE